MTNSFRRILFVFASLLAIGLVACIIGPKHDDPEAPTNADTGVIFGDTDRASDTTSGGDAGSDTSIPLAPDGADAVDGGASDGCADGESDADADGGCGDALGDAVTEGG